MLMQYKTLQVIGDVRKVPQTSLCLSLFLPAFDSDLVINCFLDLSVTLTLQSFLLGTHSSLKSGSLGIDIDLDTTGMSGLLTGREHEHLTVELDDDEVGDLDILTLTMFRRFLKP